jgi:glycosyltransferase involved in cell wall biosynthesis
VHLTLLPQQQFDIIISSSDPKSSHIVVDNLIRKGLKFNKWIQYWGDPLTIDITSKHIYPKYYTKHVERRILKAANKIIYVSPFTLQEQQKLFPKLAQKMTFLPIPYEYEKVYAKTKNEKFVVGYFGYYVKGIRNIFPLYEAFKNINTSLQLNIVGGSDIQLQTIDNIGIYPISNNISEFEKNCDLLVVILNSQGSQIPGKVYHAAATNKPVLVILDGENKYEIRSYLEKYDRFYFCENDSKNIADAINIISKRDKQFNPCKELSAKYIAHSFLD